MASKKGLQPRSLSEPFIVSQDEPPVPEERFLFIGMGSGGVSVNRNGDVYRHYAKVQRIGNKVVSNCPICAAGYKPTRSPASDD